MAESKPRSPLMEQNITVLQQMISSGTGSVLTSLTVTPLDVVKIRLQAQQKVLQTNKCFLYCNGFVEQLCCSSHANGNSTLSLEWYRTSGHMTGTMDAFIKISRAEGIASLWSGLPPTLIMAIPSNVVYFTLYDRLHYAMVKGSKKSYEPLWAPVVAGAMARAMSTTLISPLELVRTKMQSQKLSYLEIGRAVRNLVQAQGLRSLWRGLGPTFLRDVPFSSLYWVNYEFLKQRYNQQEQTTFWFSIAAGACAGTIAALLTLPFDVIKTHRQIELGEMSTLTRKRSSTYSNLKMLYERNGYRALFAGAVPRIIKVAPGCAIMISTYEYGKRFFHNRNLENS